MQLPRSLTLVIQFLLDELVPPLIRDSKWFVWLPFRLLFGDKAAVFFDFKSQAWRMTRADFAAVYRDTATVHIDRPTDLNAACVRRILDAVVGDTLLDVGCGRGYLVGRLLGRGRVVTGVDMQITPEMANRFPAAGFVAASAEALPFADASMDTVVCAHTLEHVQNFGVALAELRRVAARRLIVVVPKQRNYRYTFDLHLRFFAHPHDLLLAVGKAAGTQSCSVVGGDLYYQEERCTDQPKGASAA